MLVQKYCNKCNTIKDTSEFNVHKHRSDGLQVYCKSCMKKIIKDIRENKPDYVPVQCKRYCSNFLGCYIAETVLSSIYENVERMPYGNVGYDFVCAKGYKIDCKAAIITTAKNGSSRWVFAINKNKIADYFLLLGFDNRDNLTPMKCWLIPGHVLNNNVLVGIALSVSDKWKEYEKDIDKVIASCDLMKHKTSKEGIRSAPVLA